MVRFLIIWIGAINVSVRSSSDSWRVSFGLLMSVIRKLLFRRDWMLAMLIIFFCFIRIVRLFVFFLSLFLYFINRVVIGLSMLFLVKLDMMLLLALSSEMLICGWLYSFWLEVESVIWLSVRITRLYSIIGWFSRVCFILESFGTRSDVVAVWLTLVFIRRNFSVVVVFRIFFVRVVFWIFGSLITIRLVFWRWIIGFVTLSWFIRLRRILMFCCIVYLRVLFRRVSFIIVRSWLLFWLLIIRFGWRLFRYVMVLLRVLVSRKVMFRS